MSRSDNQRLEDILHAARRLIEITADGRETFENDWVRSAAAERMMLIIGEAASKLSEEAKSARPDVPWAAMRAFRNFVVHEYHKVDRALLWEAMSRDIPQLTAALTDDPQGPPT